MSGHELKIEIEIPQDELLGKLFKVSEGHTAFEVKEAARQFWNLVQSYGTRSHTEQNEMFTVRLADASQNSSRLEA